MPVKTTLSRPVVNTTDLTKAASHLFDLVEQARHEQLRLGKLVQQTQTGPLVAGGAAMSDLDRRIRSIDTWLASRLAQLQDAEAVAEKRANQLERLEGSLKKLSAVLAEQMGQVEPARKDMAELRQQMETAGQELAERAAGQVEQLVKQIDQRFKALFEEENGFERRILALQGQADLAFKPVEAAVREHLATLGQQAQAMLVPVEEQVSNLLDQATKAEEHIKTLTARANLGLEGAEEKWLARIEAVEQRVAEVGDKIAADLQGRIDEKTQACGELDKVLDQQVESWQRRAGEAFEEQGRKTVEELTSRVERAMDQNRRQVEVGIEGLKNVEEACAARLTNLARQVATKEQMVQQSLQQMQTQAERTISSLAEKLEASRQSARAIEADVQSRCGQLVEKLEEEAEQKVTPILSRLERQVKTAEEREESFRGACTRMVEDMEKRLEQQVHAALVKEESFRGVCTQMVEGFEQRVRQQVEEAGKSAAQKQAECAAAASQLTEETAKIQAQTREIMDHAVLHLAEIKQKAVSLLEPAERNLLLAAEKIEAEVSERLAGMEEQAEERLEAMGRDVEALQTAAGATLASLEGNIKARLADAEAKVQEMIQPAQTALEEKFRREQEDLEKTLTAYEQSLAHRAKQFEAVSEAMTKAFAAQMDEHVRNLRGQVAGWAEPYAQEIQKQIHTWTTQSQTQIAEAMAQVMAQGRASTDQTRVDMQRFLDELKPRLTEMAAEQNRVVEQCVDAQRESFGQTLAQLQGELEGKIEAVKEDARTIFVALEQDMLQGVDRFDEKALATLTQWQEKLKGHMTAVRQEAEEIAEPIVAKLEERLADFTGQASAALEELKNTISAQVTQQRENALAAMDWIEEQVADRLGAIKPRATAVLDETDQFLRERLGHLQANNQAMVEVCERQLAKRLRRIEPKAASIFAEAEKMVQTHSVHLEQEIEQAVQPVAQRLSARIGELAQQGRQTAEETLRLLDEVCLKITRITGSDPRQPQDGGHGLTKLIEALQQAHQAIDFLKAQQAAQPATSEKPVVLAKQPLRNPAVESGVQKRKNKPTT
ncbi:MAG: hypothetical protein IT443_08650 [Phycisphaeraceae bacterium]|nr:hypothetical protein [Phycisphaeraceae bacterium]